MDHREDEPGGLGLCIAGALPPDAEYAPQRAGLHQTLPSEFIEYYNQRRYHGGIGNVAPADVYYGRREKILRRRKEQKELTIQARLRYNRGRKEPQPEGGSKLKTIAAASGS